MTKLFKHTIFCLFCILGILNSLFAVNISGIITDEKNEVLPYATVIAKGTNLGATANEQGRYILELANGDYTLIFQYLGYEKEFREIHVEGKNLNVNIQLRPSVFSLAEISVSSKQEDPAYRIIREAIANRKKNGRVDFSYKAEAYTKGIMKILDSPLKILGQKVGNMEGILDSNRQGILYLSETYSKIEFDPPKDYKETILSSKVSGDNNGFSFNQANALNFNLYENTISFGADIISPIADYAMNFYSYSLIGLTRQKDGTGIYRISFKPKNIVESAWTGDIFIQEGIWSIDAFNAYVLGKQIKQTLFDTMWIHQQHASWMNNQLHQVQSQIFEFKAGLLGIKLYGKFLLDFSKFDRKELLSLKNKSEILIIESGANLKSSAYWDSIRPIPLTVEEKQDYKIKDSLILVKNSKPYKDSLDKISNVFEWSKLLFGYTYQNSYKKRYFAFVSPVQLIQFHPVSGLLIHANFRYSKYLDEQTWFRNINTEFNTDYGFAENKLRIHTAITYSYDPFKNKFIRCRFGSQLTPIVPVNEFLNQFACLFWKNNQLKLYQRKFFDFSYGTDINYDWRIKLFAGYSARKNVDNNSQYSIRFPNTLYANNSMSDAYVGDLFLKNKNILYTGINLIWQPRTKVTKTPLEIQKLGSIYPEFGFGYNFKLYDSDRSIHDLIGSIKQRLELNRWGEFQYKLKGIYLVGKNRDVSEKIFANSQAFPIYMSQQDERESFLVANPYAIEISSFGLQSHMYYNMKGLVLDNIPILKRLGWNENIRFSMLNRKNDQTYWEFGLGLSNIGYKAFRLINLDWIQVFEGRKYRGNYLRLGISSSLRVGN